MWPFKKKIEKRNFSDILINQLTQSATSSVALATSSSALEIVAGNVGKAFLCAEVKGTDLLTPSVLKEIGRDLLIYGESVWSIQSGELVRASSYDVEGGFTKSSWRYHLTFPSPSRTHVTVKMGQKNVFHFLYSVEVHRPWRGVSPLSRAISSGEFVARIEKSLSQEAGGVVGHLLPVVKDGDDNSLSELRTSLARLSGNVALVETQRNMTGDMQTVPRKEWEPQRIGHAIPQGTSLIYDSIFKSTLGVLGFPYDLIESPGAAQREAYRRFVMLTVAPLGKIISSEVMEKTGIPVSLDFNSLMSADIAGRARAYKGFKEAGLKDDEAKRLVGL